MHITQKTDYKTCKTKTHQSELEDKKTTQGLLI